MAPTACLVQVAARCMEAAAAVAVAMVLPSRIRPGRGVAHGSWEAGADERTRGGRRSVLWGSRGQLTPRQLVAHRSHRKGDAFRTCVALRSHLHSLRFTCKPPLAHLLPSLPPPIAEPPEMAAVAVEAPPQAGGLEPNKAWMSAEVRGSGARPGQPAAQAAAAAAGGPSGGQLLRVLTNRL